MTDNLLPWLALAGAVLASLAWKGYLRLPPPRPAPAPSPAPAPPTAAAVPAGVDAAKLSSHELGVLMALAARREAEASIAEQIAKDAAERLKATFTAPFSPEGPEPRPGG